MSSRRLPPIVWFALLLVTGCARTAADDAAGNLDAGRFAPVSMRLHPVFTRVADWTGDGRADGIEAIVEFYDRFDDPAKASGTMVFELYDHDPAAPDGRGRRIGQTWTGSLVTLDLQAARYNRQLRGYEFKLDRPGLGGQTLALLARFNPLAGRRLEDTAVLTPRPASRAATAATDLPPNAPTPRSPEP